MNSSLVAFVVIAAALTVTPGADMALVMRHSLAGGRTAAFFATLGICSGLVVHAVASSAGLSVILSRSAVAFEVVRSVGVVYLVYLGVQTLREGVLAEAPPASPDEDSRRRRCFAQGFLTNLLNPKVALFYLTFLPQFVVPGEGVLGRSLLLASLHIAMGLAWLTLYALLIERFLGLLRSAAVKRRIQAITGTLRIGLGVRLAFERR